MTNIRKYIFFGAFAFLLAVAGIPPYAQAREVTLTPDQLSGLTITLPNAGEFLISVVATGTGGSVTRTMKVLAQGSVSLPTSTVQDAQGPVGKPIPLDITAADATSVTIAIPDAATLSPETSLPRAVGAPPLPAPDKTISATCGQGQLSAVISQAKAEALTGLNVRVVLPSCVYREELNISNVTSGSIDIVAAVPGTAVLSGADVFTGWAQDANGIWFAVWPYDFGLHWPSKWPSRLPQDEVLKRVETFFVDGSRLTQVTAYADLVDESFAIDEFGNKVFIKSTNDLTVSLVEGTVRPRSVQIRGSENIALRGIRQQHAASEVQASAVRILESANILLEDMTIRDNSGVGLSVSRTNFITTRRVQFLDNGYNGYTAFKATGLLSEDDAVSGSNWRGFPFGYSGWAVSGLKHLKIHRAIYRRLTATNNLTRGFWLDTDIENVVIEDNVWSDNLSVGAFLEKIQGPLLIRGLTVSNNAKGGILVAQAQKVTIEDSQVSNNEFAQIHFSGDASWNGGNFETGGRFTVTTDLWAVTDSSFSALGTQTVLAGSFIPPNLTASGNTCETQNPTTLDEMICR